MKIELMKSESNLLMENVFKVLEYFEFTSSKKLPLIQYGIIKSNSNKAKIDKNR